MARGSTILINQIEAKGRKLQCYLGTGVTPKPGTILQLQPATALRGGLFTVELYNADADGGRPKGPFLVLLEDSKQGKTVSDAYAAGELAECYVPLPGDELNLLLLDVAGTGDDHTKGETLIVDDTTGKLIATTGSPETEVAMLLETVTDPVADTLAHTIWTGH